MLRLLHSFHDRFQTSASEARSGPYTFTHHSLLG